MERGQERPMQRPQSVQATRKVSGRSIRAAMTWPKTHCLGYLLTAFLLLLALSRISSGAAATRPATIPFPVLPANEFKAALPRELTFTHPDYVVFVPSIDDASTNQTGNEHFIVFDGPHGSLMAVWTQSTREGQPDQHIVFVRSEDEGVTWSKPRIIAGPAQAGQGNIASWAFPLISRTGRIYVVYSQHVGKFDTFFHTTGQMSGIFSDDDGKNWSGPQAIPVQRTARDNPDESYPANWICWQKPTRIAKDGKYLAGITRWTSTAVLKNPSKSWTSHDSGCEFIRFENIDENPDPAEIRVTLLTPDEKALRVPHPKYPNVSVCQEPAIVKLPDGRLFCVMRTIAGSPFWSVSLDQGQSWSGPRRLLNRDGGDALMHPLAPSPMYDVQGDGAGSGSYVLFIHGNDGHYRGSTPEQTDRNRRPLFLLKGRFHEEADQPVWFDEPVMFFEHTDTPLGQPGGRGRVDLAMYSSFTVRNGARVFWYPDRKFFLLGRKIAVDANGK
jgi:hypothetical protein